MNAVFASRDPARSSSWSREISAAAERARVQVRDEFEQLRVEVHEEFEQHRMQVREGFEQLRVGIEELRAEEGR